MVVAAVPGIVTARRTNGYFIQDPRPDRDRRTSEGIFVFTEQRAGSRAHARHGRHASPAA